MSRLRLWKIKVLKYCVENKALFETWKSSKRKWNIILWGIKIWNTDNKKYFFIVMGLWGLPFIHIPFTETASCQVYLIPFLYFAVNFVASMANLYILFESVWDALVKEHFRAPEFTKKERALTKKNPTCLESFSSIWHTLHNICVVFWCRISLRING